MTNVALADNQDALREYQHAKILMKQVGFLSC